MSRNRLALFSAVVGILITFAVAILYLAPRPQEQPGLAHRRAFASTSAVQGQRLPAYRLVTLEEKELSPDELRQGRVLLVFLTTGCEPCIKELDIVSHLQRDAPSDLRIYGVGIERPDQVATFAKELDLKFPILIDMSAQLAKSLDIHYFPSIYLVEDGIITQIWRGKTQNEAELRQRLNIKGVN